MPDIDQSVNNFGSDVGKGLGHKFGPLPVWGWVVVLGGGGFAVYYLFFRSREGAAAPVIGSAHGGTGPPPFLGGGGGLGGIGSAVQENAQKLTNLDWLNKAMDTVPQALAIDPLTARLYLEEYLSGRRPVGSARAVTLYERVKRAAIEAAGPVPNPPSIPEVNVNPFASNLGWLQNALGFVPAGTTTNIRQELIDLINGVRTEVSQETADLINNLRDTLGSEPNPLSFTITQPGQTPADTRPLIPNLTSIPSLLDGALAALKQTSQYQDIFKVASTGNQSAWNQMVTLEAQQLAQLTSLPIDYARNAILQMRYITATHGGRMSTPEEQIAAIREQYVASGVYRQA